MRVSAFACVLAWFLTPPATTPAAPAPPGGGERINGIVVTGKATPTLASFDDAMTRFMADNKIPGGALAVSRNGRLVYARGFGYADVDAKLVVQPMSLFRIASVSKPFTAVAIMQLVEQKKLSLDDKPFSLLGLEPHLKPDAKPDVRIAQISVRQLLTHTSGWDDDKFDPMFRSATVAKELGVPCPPGSGDIIRFMSGRPLDFAPGEKYAYSNFNYNVLGRVIEKVSGTTYEQYVREKVLRPLGIRSMRVGRSLEKDRAASEVKYYESQDARVDAVVGDQIGQQVRRCYGGFYLEATDAHGGWIATAPELVRFATAFDNLNSPRLLKAPTVQQMFAPPSAGAGTGPTYYACGWNVRPLKEGRMNVWHGGRLRYSTCSMLVRRADGTDYAILFNTMSETIRQGMEDPVRKAAEQVKTWPAQDLFPALLQQGDPAVQKSTG